jgi:hypothetical protein
MLLIRPILSINAPDLLNLVPPGRSYSAEQENRTIVVDGESF